MADLRFHRAGPDRNVCSACGRSIQTRGCERAKRARPVDPRVTDIPWVLPDDAVIADG